MTACAAALAAAIAPSSFSPHRVFTAQLTQRIPQNAHAPPYLPLVASREVVRCVGARHRPLCCDREPVTCVSDFLVVKGLVGGFQTTHRTGKEVCARDGHSALLCPTLPRPPQQLFFCLLLLCVRVLLGLTPNRIANP